jgi:peptide/nickel transport system substrate-binding protein
VRRAFELSLDRQALVQVVYNGLFTPTAQVEAPGSPFYLKDIQPQPRDVAKAKALLKEAGVTVPVVVNLIVPNAPEYRQVGEIVQSMASEAGFDVHITATEYASALNASSRGDFESFLTAWSGRVDPDGNLYSFLHTGAPSNDAKYTNPKVDEDLDKARLVSDVAQRRALYDDLFHQTVQDLPILYLWQLENLVGLSAKVNGFVQVPDGMIRLQGVTLGK